MESSECLISLLKPCNKIHWKLQTSNFKLSTQVLFTLHTQIGYTRNKSTNTNSITWSTQQNREENGKNVNERSAKKQSAIIHPKADRILMKYNEILHQNLMGRDWIHFTSYVYPIFVLISHRLVDKPHYIDVSTKMRLHLPLLVLFNFISITIHSHLFTSSFYLVLERRRKKCATSGW